MHRYIESLKGVLDRIAAEQASNIAQSAEIVARCLATGGIVHTFGSGHSHMIAEEAFYRAGGLAAINPILDPALLFLHGALESTRAERQPGYAAELLARESIGELDCGIVISNSGRNATPVQMALLLKSRGLPVIAVTNLAQSQAAVSRDASGKRLFEVADVTIDNCIPSGDACIDLPEGSNRMAPASTVAGAAIIHSVMLEAAERLQSRGETPAILPSANVGDNAEEALRRMLACYSSRIRLLDA